MLLTFFGPKRWAPQAHPHESPASMTWPMIILGIGSVAAGGLLVFGDGLPGWLEPVVGEHHSELAIPVWSMTVIVLRRGGGRCRNRLAAVLG